ncbi:hypothetical protein D3C86_310460 [compost metagenome]
MGLIRKWQITQLINRRESEYRDLSFKTLPQFRMNEREMIDAAFIQSKKNILEGKVSILDYVWTFFKCEVRDLYWYRRQKKLQRYIDYNTPYTLANRRIVSDCYRGVPVDDADTQRLVDVFCEEYDKAKQQIKDDRLRVGLELS